MATCEPRKSKVNGEESILTNMLNQEFGFAKTGEVLELIYSDAFLDKYGDFTEGLSKIPVDETGKEPTFEWVKENLLKPESILLSTKESPLEVYVDGSDIKGTGRIGFGVNITHGGKDYSISGAFDSNNNTALEKDLGITIDGTPSNGAMEFYGSLVALRNTPIDEHITINQDLEGVQLWILSGMMAKLSKQNMTSKKAYDKWYKGLSEETKADYFERINKVVKLDQNLVSKFDWDGRKGFYAADPVIAAIQGRMVEELLKRKGKVTYKWVKGHSGNIGNEKVDGIAKNRENFNSYRTLFAIPTVPNVVTNTSNETEATAQVPIESLLGKTFKNAAEAKTALENAYSEQKAQIEANIGNTVQVKYDSYSNSFQATVTGAVMGSYTLKGGEEVSILELPDYGVNLKTNTGKEVSAQVYEITGLKIAKPAETAAETQPTAVLETPFNVSVANIENLQQDIIDNPEKYELEKEIGNTVMSQRVFIDNGKAQVYQNVSSKDKAISFQKHVYTDSKKGASSRINRGGGINFYKDTSGVVSNEAKQKMMNLVTTIENNFPDIAARMKAYTDKYTGISISYDNYNNEIFSKADNLAAFDSFLYNKEALSEEEFIAITMFDPSTNIAIEQTKPAAAPYQGEVSVTPADASADEAFNDSQVFEDYINKAVKVGLIKESEVQEPDPDGFGEITEKAYEAAKQVYNEENAPSAEVDPNAKYKRNTVESTLKIVLEVPAPVKGVKPTPIPREELKQNIAEEFIKVAEHNPDKIIYVGYENPKSYKWPLTNGYTVAQIAEVFDEIRTEMGIHFPQNLQFYPAFESVMLNSASRLVAEAEAKFGPEHRTSLTEPNSKKVKAVQMQMQVPVVEGEVGVETFGDRYGTDVQMDVSLGLTHIMMKKVIANEKVGIAQLMADMLQAVRWIATHSQRMHNEIQTEETERLAKIWADVRKSFAFMPGNKNLSFTSLLLDQFENLGYTISNKTRNQINKVLAQNKNNEDTELTPEFLAANAESSLENVFEAINDGTLERLNLDFDDTITGEDGQGLADFFQTSFQLDARNTASTRLKAWMSLQPVTDLEGNEIKNSMNLTTLVDFNQLFERTKQTLGAQHKLTLVRAIELLEHDGNPEMYTMAQRLKAQPGETAEAKNGRERNAIELLKVMNLQFADSSVLLMNSTKTNSDMKQMEVKFISEQRGASFQATIQRWQERFMLSDMMKVEDGQYTVNRDRAMEQYRAIQAISMLWDEATSNEEHKAQFNEAIQGIEHLFGIEEDIYETLLDDMKSKKDPAGKRLPVRTKLAGIVNRMLTAYGIDMSTVAMEHMFNSWGDSNFDNIEQLVKGSGMDGKLSKQFKTTQDGIPVGLFSSFFHKATGLNDEAENDDFKHNPLFSESKTMSILARQYGKYEGFILPSNYKNFDGKSIQSFVLPSAHSMAMLEFKQDNDTFRKNKLKNAMLSSNGEDLDGNWHFQNMSISQFDLQYIGGSKKKRSTKGRTVADFSDREMLHFSMNAFLNHGYKTANMTSMAMSDKVVAILHKGVPRLEIRNIRKSANNAPRKEAVSNIFFELVLGEHRRMTTAQSWMKAKGTTGDAKYDIGSQYFLRMSMFNYDSLMENGNTELAGLMYDASGKIKQDISSDDIRARARSVIDTWLNKITLDAINRWNKADLSIDHLDKQWVELQHDQLDGSKETFGTKRDYMNLKAAQEAVAKKISQENYALLENERLNAEELAKSIKEAQDHLVALSEARRKAILKAAIEAHAINSVLWNINVSSMFYGDPAQAWKGDPKNPQPTDVAITYADYIKRLSKDIAPGQVPVMERTHYNHITLKDVTEKESLSYIKEFGGTIGEANATDAQEVTTTQEYLDLMKGLGEMTVDKHKELSDIVKKAGPGGYYKFTPEQLAKLVKPLGPTKPVYAGLHRAKEGWEKYNYDKMSRYPLLPQLTSRHPRMEALRQLMEKPDKNDPDFSIQVAGFESAHKLGAPVLLDFFGKDSEPTAEQIKASTQPFEYRNLRFQQDLPFDAEKETVKIVTQMNKLITEGIMGMEGFKIGGKTMNANQVIAERRAIRKAMVDSGVKELYAKLDVKSKEEFDKLKISKMLAAEARDGNYSPNEILLLEEFNSTIQDLEFPIGAHQSFEKFESLLMSVVKQIVNNKVKGKSYVQASSTGYETVKKEGELTAKQKKGIVYVAGREAGPLKFITKDGPNGPVIIAAEVLAPFNFTYTNAAGAKVHARVEDFLDANGDLDPTRVPPELLELIGARIPNQGHNSMLPMKVVGFVPDGMGDLIIVPSAITAQMGADFDVDKLYTYKRPYKWNEDTEGFEKVDRAIAEDGIETEEQLQDRYFDLHQGILTHPDMYAKIAQMLDRKDLVELNKKYETKVDDDMFWTNSNQIRLQQAGKDAKTLVGRTSLASTFNSVLQTLKSDIKLGHFTYNSETKRYEPRDDIFELNGLPLARITGNGYHMQGDTKYTKHDNFSMYQNGALDFIKDRTLDNLNISKALWPAVQALHQLETIPEDKTKPSKILSVQFVVALMTQDAAKEFTNMMRQGQDNLTEEYSSESLEQAVLKKLKEKYPAPPINEDGTMPTLPALNEKTLKEWYENKAAADYKEGQHAVVLALEKALRLGNRMNKMQQSINQDTKGPGPSLLYVQQQQSLHDSLYHEDKKVFLNESALVEDTEWGDMYNAVIPLAAELGNALIPFDTIKDIMVHTAAMLGKETVADLSLKTQTDMFRAMRSALSASNSAISTDLNTDRLRLLMNSPTHKSLGKRLTQFKMDNPNSPYNYFLNNIRVITGKSTTGPDTLAYRINRNGAEDEYRINKEFSDMLLSQDETVKALGEDLIRYGLLIEKGGGVSISSKIPAAFLVGTTYSRALRAQFESLPENAMQLIEQALQHMPYLTPKMPQAVISQNAPEYKLAGQGFPEMIAIDSAAPVHEDIYLTEKNQYNPLIHYIDPATNQLALYKLQSVGGKLIMYQRIDVLGSGTLQEYNLSAKGVVRSVISENRAAAEFSTPNERASLENVLQYNIERRQTDDAFRNWHVSDGGGVEQIQRILGQISNDKQMPAYLRKISAHLQPTVEDRKAIAFLMETGDTNPLTYEVTTMEKAHYLGNYSTSNRKITINKGLSKEASAIAMLHEMTHHRTAALATSFGFYIEGIPAAVKTKMAERVRAMREANPELAEKFDALDKMRYEAYKYLEANPELDPDGALEYALSNLHEFMSHVLTDKNLMQFLNSIESTTADTRSFGQKILDAFLDIVASIAEYMGMKVDERSILVEAYKLTLDINQAVETTSPSVDSTGQIVSSEVLFPTEFKAIMFQSAVETAHGQEAIMTDMGTHYSVHPGKKKPTSSNREVQKAITKLEKQVEKLDSLILSVDETPADKERRFVATRLRDEIANDLQKLAYSSDIRNLYDIGAKQLAWVKDIVKKTHAHPQEIIMASTLLESWLTMQDLYGDGVGINPDFKTAIDDLVGDAKAVVHNLDLLFNKTFINIGIAEGYKITPLDIESGLKNAIGATKQALTLSRNSNKLAQLLNKVVQRSANQAHTEMVGLKKELEQYIKDVKAYAKSKGISEKDVYKMITDQSGDPNSWGLIQMVKPQWFTELAKHHGALVKEVNTYRHHGAKLSEGKKLFESYWKKVLKKSAVLDMRVTFDPVTGEKLNTPEAQAEYDRLVKETGDESLVKEAFEKAAKKAELYSFRREKEFYLLDNSELNLDEALLPPADRAAALAERIAKEKKAWEHKHSIYSFLDTQEANAPNEAFTFESTSSPVFLPKAGSDAFDARFKTIQDDTALAAIHKYMQNASEKFLQYLPAEKTRYKHRNFLPVISNSMITEYLGFLGKFNVSKLGQKAWELYTVHSNEVDRQHKNEIKISHLQKPPTKEDGTIDYDALSIDLPRMMEMFGNMAIHYKHMQPMEHMIELTERIVKKESQKRRDLGEEALEGLEEMIDFYKDTLVYQKPKTLEMTSKQKVYAPIWEMRKGKSHAAIKKTVADLQAQVIKLEDELMLEGAPESDPRRKEVAELKQRLADYDEQARHVSGSRIATSLIAFNQLRALAFNPFVAVTNLTFGLLSTSMHARGFRADLENGYTSGDFTAKQLREMMWLMKGNVAASWGSLLNVGRGEMGEQIKDIMDDLGLIDVLIDTSHGNTSLEASQRSWFKKNFDVFAAQKSGDFFTKGTLALSVLRNTQMEYEGKQTNALEVLLKHGKEKIDWDNLKPKIKHISTIVFGNQDKLTPLMLRKYALGQLIGQFRASWLPEGVNSRFGVRYEDAQLGRTVEGRFRTYGKLGGNGWGAVSTLAKQVMSVFTGNDPFEGVTTYQPSMSGVTKGEPTMQPIQEHEKENMRRNLAGLGYTLAVMAMIQMLKYLKDLDDDDEGTMGDYYMFVLNLMNRTHQDLRLYSSPDIVDQVLGNIVPSMSVIQDFQKAGKSYAKLFDEDADLWNDFWLKQFKVIPGASNIPKVKYMMERDLSTSQR
jgi:ribonuclease HI